VTATAFAPPAQAAAALSTDADGATLVCGIAGLPRFHARSLAALWADGAGLPAAALGAITIELQATPAAGWAPASLAAALEREPRTLR
jgi:hypothetical protein